MKIQDVSILGIVAYDVDVKTTTAGAPVIQLGT